MMSNSNSLTQAQRLAALLIDTLIVAIACLLLFGAFYPPLGASGFWAYSALLAVLIGSKLITPFYVKPADAIAYAVPAFVSLMLVNEWGSWPDSQRIGFLIAVGFSALVFLLGMAGIALNSVESDSAKKASDKIRLALDVIAKPQWIYMPLIIFAVFSFHGQSWLEAVVILVVAMLTVIASTGEFFVRIYKRLLATPAKRIAAQVVEVVAFQEPGIILLRQQQNVQVNKNDVFYVVDTYGPRKIAVALDSVGRSEGILIRAVVLGMISPENSNVLGDVSNVQCGYKLSNADGDALLRAENIPFTVDSRIVGIVTQDTSVDRLYFEVTDDSELRVGRLVSAYVGGRKVLYQIVGGLTREEVVQQKNTYGYVRGQAQQIGIWDGDANKFVPCEWLPTLNAPVALEDVRAYQFEQSAVGHFPETNLHARIESTADLVTHNTAILGILGIGKSRLSFELVERLLADGIKVICLDITDEYRDALNDFLYDIFRDELFGEVIENTGADGKKIVKKNVEEGGNKPSFAAAVDPFIERFISTRQDRNLLVINPAQFELWRQDSKPFSNEASMASLSPTEVTQLFAEAALKACQKLGRVEKGVARVCLVFEEAHSLIPEWNAVVNEGDRAAVNGTARAILQGRKFGLGCLLITQRTASVTKTILNQCNTVFAMRTFDETGKDFLSNYVGRSYADSLPSMPERHAVLFGKASSCENPVFIRLNDSDVFQGGFRAVHPVPDTLPVKGELADSQACGEVALGANDEFDDNIPF